MQNSQFVLARAISCFFDDPNISSCTAAAGEERQAAVTGQLAIRGPDLENSTRWSQLLSAVTTAGSRGY